MKRLFVLVGFVCLIAMLLSACAPAPEPEPEPAPEPAFDEAAEQAAVQTAVENLVATFNSKDVKAFVALFDDVFVGWEVGDKPTRERQEAAFTEYFAQQKDVNSTITQEVGIVFVTPDVAIYKAYADVTGAVDDDGKAMPQEKVLGAWVMVKKGGNWMLAAYFGRPTEESPTT